MQSRSLFKADELLCGRVCGAGLMSVELPTRACAAIGDGG
jgi:hypothetical protein